MVSFEPLTVVYILLTLIPAMVLHEVSHGLVADRMGDSTPRVMGRLTVNPAPHLDPFGTIVLPGLLILPYLFGRGVGPIFGYAKPMPLNPSNLKNPDRQVMLIAVAGPVTNLLLAVAGALSLRFVGTGAGALADFLGVWVFLNVLMAVFNIMPIPPLDGSKVLARFLPTRAREVYQLLEPYGALFMLVVFFLFPGLIFAIVDPVVDGLFALLVG